MSHQNNGPIFIVGAPRSGTTLLQFRLRNHPRISLPTGESHFIVPLYLHQTTYDKLDTPQGIKKVLQLIQTKSSEFVATDLHGIKFDIDEITTELLKSKCDTLPKIISWIFEKNAEGEGKTRWGEKTPYYLLHLPKILEWWPDAQIIHIIRDGRDVALSLLERKHDFFVYNFYTAAKEWCKYIEIGRQLGRKIGNQQYLEIKYEALISSPEETMKKVCDFLTEEYTEDLFIVKKTNDPGKTPLVHEQIKSDNFEKWRKMMNTRQLRVFEGVAKHSLLETGYSLSTDGSPIPFLQQIIYLAHNKTKELYWRKKLSKSTIGNFTIKQNE